MTTILPFNAPEATLEKAGGKGANLARLTRAGFDVPPGFIVSTEGYRSFVATNGLQTVIRSALENLSAEDAGALEAASAQIRAAFSAGQMPLETEQAVVEAYTNLPHPTPLRYGGFPNPSPEGRGTSVAVRSSATAEDLPDLSFAGQQDTFLNVIGTEELLKAVINCWSSLWTARAIGYRTRNKIPQGEVSLAVVIQQMIQSEVSGVLFTANPLTGLLSESVIDATFGLGEALVSGQVEPDHFVVNSLSGEVNEIKLGAKKMSTRGKKGGGVETVAENAEARQTLADNEIRQLVAMGQSVQKEYAFPQDIEWALADGKLYLLQSRAITSLFPTPEVSFDPLVVWFSFGAVQGLVGPLTPLGQDAIKNVVASASTMFGEPRGDPRKFKVFAQAGERLWIKISDLMRHPIGGKVIGGALDFVEPSVGQILKSLVTDPRLGARQGKLKLSTLRKLMHFFGPILVRLVRNTIDPQKGRAEFDARIDNYLATAQISSGTDRFERLANSVVFMRERIANALPFLLPYFIPVFGPSMGALGLLAKIAGKDEILALEVTRGLPGNVTTEMDLALWETAAALKVDAEAAKIFRETDSPQLASRYLNGSLPPVAQSAIRRFMERYGMRGVGEIDLGQPRWREDPTPVMHTLQSYLQIDPNLAPDVVFAKGGQAALAAIEKLAVKARQQPGGWLKEKLVRAAGRRIRLLMSARESPKFFAIRMMGIGRQALLEVGEEFVAAGTIEKAGDLAFLTLDELEELAQGTNRKSGVKNLEIFDSKPWKFLIAERKAVFERELHRRQVPRVLVSDGRAFYEGLGAETAGSDVISGSPVSPGVVEGVVHVVFDPRGTQLAPGEILVCPGTDPAWTPLFLSAGGLITEVGGMMTHGSVVAREYGIPAVVGVHQATSRLKDGQRIRVDGTAGKIVITG